MRNLSLGILGMKWPLLSSTDTSTVTVTASALKVGTPSGSWLSFLLNLEGILGCSASLGWVSPFFLGRATVSLPELLGPWARENRATPSAHAETTARTRRVFMTGL